MTDSPTILVIDNYDSFVYILVQYLGELGASPVVRRHDEIDLDGIRALDPDGMLMRRRHHSCTGRERGGVGLGARTARFSLDAPAVLDAAFCFSIFPFFGFLFTRVYGVSSFPRMA